MSYIEQALAEVDDTQTFAFDQRRGIIRPALPKKPDLPVVGTRPGYGVPSYRANFNFVIKRNSANINKDLPIVLFGSADFFSGYFGVVDVPPGLTYAVSGGLYSGPTAYDFIRFTWNEGANTDNIDIRCNEYPYPAFLKSTETDIFIVNYMKYFIPSAAFVDQYNRKMTYKKRSLFGLEDKQNVPIKSNQNTRDFRDNIVEMPVRFAIDKQRMFVLEVMPAVIEITLSFNVDFYKKEDAIKEL